MFLIHINWLLFLKNIHVMIKYIYIGSMLLN